VPTTTPTATATPTDTPIPTGTPAPSGKVVIRFIFYDGRSDPEEGDEYAEIANAGITVVNLQGWRLNADDEGQDMVFPPFFLQPGQICRVYTNELHPEHCGFIFGSDQAVWANGGECGHLYDAGGAEVSTYCYAKSRE
jgi:hypothetical protein